MAAYATLVSVMQIIDQIQHHPHPPISIHEEQVEYLTANVTFLQDFLEGYNPRVSYTAEADPLESRIAEAGYAAEDVIESYIVDQINLARSTDHVEEISSTEFYQGLRKVIEEMDLIKMDVKKKMKEKKITRSVTDVGSSTSTSILQKVAMVGVDGVLYEMLEKMVRGGVHREIIPIVGMGGIGKTTLARAIYLHPLVKEHFDVCAWSTISQVHNAQKIFKEILDQVGQDYRGDMSEYELGEKLYKYLIGRRYLVVMDDIWSIEAWDKVRIFFPDNGNGSRMIMTTRLSHLASEFNLSNGLDMKFLDEASSWNLFSKTVFREEICPPELEDIGKKIVKGCRGLPLSIVVIGGLLSKSRRTREKWESIEHNLNSIVNLEDNERCLQILYTSYNDLPVYLKPCFLYMGGLASEDEEIHVASLMPQLAAEGILKPIDGKSLEEVGEKYVEELGDRNLILVEKRRYCGKMKYCKLHDLLRDLSLREARKMKFLCMLGDRSIHESPRGRSIQRRIASLSVCPPTPLFESASFVRSLIGELPNASLSDCRLLRVYFLDNESETETSDQHLEHIFLKLVNLRYLLFDFKKLHPLPGIPSSLCFYWNLQTVFLGSIGHDDRIFEIWKMPLLRHVIAFGELPDHPITGDEVVLQNLQTLLVIENLKFGKGVVARIPNIKRLGLHYDVNPIGGDDYHLNNLCLLHKLQVLRLSFSSTFQQHALQLSFPYSLVELTLEDTKLPWEVMRTKIGPLPNLQVLKLKDNSFIGPEWEAVEGQFSNLKFLKIDHCTDLKYWTTDESSAHFPRLEHLVLRYLPWLREIPLSIGETPTLQSIELYYCSVSADDYARRIVEEQKDSGNEDIQLQVR